MKILVGYTGFVGSNIAENADFDFLCNSKNIATSFGKKPDLLIFAGVRAEMFTANNFPEKDFAHISEAFENIKKISPKKIVLISTISVCGENPRGNEDSKIDEEKLTAYGKNRLWLEKSVEAEFKNHLIVRLPALYGKNLKKNFIFDCINLIPPLLKSEKLEELSAKNPNLREFYENQENGFFKCRDLSKDERAELKSFFKSCGFSALNFTDSRSRYQFFNLSFLWNIIQKSLNLEIEKLNITAEPVSAAELYEFLEKKPFENHLEKPPLDQNLRSKHAPLFGGADGYFFRKDFVLKDIKKFCETEKN